MRTDGWQRMKELFQVALDTPPADRDELLLRECGDDDDLRSGIARMLQAHEEGDSLLDEPAAIDAADVLAPLGSEPEPGGAMGHYTLRERIGEGGMGVVYLAEQTEPVRRMVALKHIKLGMDTEEVITRFESERQALAMLNHPSVAKVFDAGVSDDGRPYFVMEHVPGVSITEYCDTRRATVEERLHLFMQVCEAIQHAHQNGIIHRDVKPSNVLVSIEGGVPTPKVIDFGVAKAINHRLTERTLLTEEGRFIGTPEYMSPEQAEMSGLSVDTRTDVYSLGVLLYELLSGSLPFEPEELRKAGFDEIRRRIREEDPPTPSTRFGRRDEETSRSIANRRGTSLAAMTRELRGDLDWITMKAMDKDRTRRYESAHGLAADVQRHLRHEPVVAGPPGAAYRVRKFARRHRVGVTAGALVTVAVLAGAAVSVAFGVTARRAQHDTEIALGNLETVAAFQASMLESIDTQTMGQLLTADIRRRVRSGLEVQERSSEEIERAMSEFRALLLTMNATDFAQSIIIENILQGAAEAIAAEFADQPLVEAHLRKTVGEVYGSLGAYDAAEPHLIRSLRLRREMLGADHLDTLLSVNSFGVLRDKQGRYGEAGELLQQGLETSERIFGEEHPTTLLLMNNLALIHEHEGRFDAAEELSKRTIALRRLVLGDEHEHTLATISNLAILYVNLGRLEEAEPLAREVHEIQRDVLGKEHRETLRSMVNLGVLLTQMGKNAQAESVLQEAAEIMERVHGEEHPYTLFAMHNLALVLQNLRKHEEAEQMFRQTMQRRGRTYGQEHWLTLSTMNSFGSMLSGLGRQDEAGPLLRDSLEGLERALPPGHWEISHARYTFGLHLMKTQQYEDAEREFLTCYESLSGAFSPEDWRALKTAERLAEIYEALDQPEQVAEWRAKLPVETPESPG